MVSCRGLAAALLLATCAAASARELQAKKAPTFAANLYEAVTKANLVTLKAAIDAAGLKSTFQKRNLNGTLFAPSEAAWQRFYQDCKVPPKKELDVAKYCSLNALLSANKNELKQFVQYMVLHGNAAAQAGNEWWPIQTNKTSFKKWPTLFNKNIMRLRFKAPNFEAHGTGRDGNIVQANLVAGKSLMHITDNVVTWNKNG